jgi:hypothetical protein
MGSSIAISISALFMALFFQKKRGAVLVGGRKINLVEARGPQPSLTPLLHLEIERVAFAA